MSEREWRFYLEDMLRFAQKIQAYSAGLDQRHSNRTTSDTTPYCVIWN